MKRIKLVLFALFLIGINPRTWSQRSTYIGAEAFVTNDIYTIKDNSNYLKTVPLLGGGFGIGVRQGLGRNSFVETGFNRKSYWRGVGFKGAFTYGNSSAFIAWIVPVRFGYRIKLVRNLYVVPVMGFSLGINRAPSYLGRGGGTSRTTQGIIEYQYTEASGSSKIFTLINPMVNLELDLWRTIQLGIYAGRSFGLNQTDQLDITYTVNGSQPIKGSATSKGQYWCYGFSFKYKLSKLWKKE